MSDTSKMAFPFTMPPGCYNAQGVPMGMTLREYAAIQAMQGILANGPNVQDHILADEAVKMADALIAELEK